MHGSLHDCLFVTLSVILKKILHGSLNDYLFVTLSVILKNILHGSLNDYLFETLSVILKNILHGSLHDCLFVTLSVILKNILHGSLNDYLFETLPVILKNGFFTSAAYQSAQYFALNLSLRIFINFKKSMFTAVHSLSTKHSNLKRQCHENFGVIILGQTTSVFNNWLRGVLRTAEFLSNWNNS